MIDALTGRERATLRGVLCAGAMCAQHQDEGAAIVREVLARPLGPQWARDLLASDRLAAAQLAHKVAVWCTVGGGRQHVEVEEQRRWWRARVDAHLTVADAARRLGVRVRWLHRMEQGEIPATRCQMAAAWGLLDGGRE